MIGSQRHPLPWSRLKGRSLTCAPSSHPFPSLSSLHPSFLLLLSLFLSSLPAPRPSSPPAASGSEAASGGPKGIMPQKTLGRNKGRMGCLLFPRTLLPLKPEMHVLSHSLPHQLLSFLPLPPPPLSATHHPDPLQVNAT